MKTNYQMAETVHDLMWEWENVPNSSGRMVSFLVDYLTTDKTWVKLNIKKEHIEALSELVNYLENKD